MTACFTSERTPTSRHHPLAVLHSVRSVNSLLLLQEFADTRCCLDLVAEYFYHSAILAPLARPVEHKPPHNVVGTQSILEPDRITILLALSHLVLVMEVSVCLSLAMPTASRH